MARRRGFFAEMQHQARLHEQRQRQAHRAAEQAHSRAVREAERARREWERNRVAQERSDAREAARYAKEQDSLRIAARQAEVDVLNAELEANYEAIDSMLLATLEIDDYVDLASLRQTVQFPAFDRPELTQPIPTPVPEPAPIEPAFVEPPLPTGLSGMVGAKKRHEAARATAWAAHLENHRAWQHEMRLRDERWFRIQAKYRDAESARLVQLAAAQEQYENDCNRARREVLSANVRLEKLMVGLQEGDPGALEEYISIVLSNSVYPAIFPVGHEFQFNGPDAELSLQVDIPRPDAVPSEKLFKYTRTTDTISSTPLPKKALKDRYANAVAQVILRSVHEIFEADRGGIVETISVTVGVRTVDPATGHDQFVPLAQLATDRSTIESLDLSRVDAQATLRHLRGAISSAPYDLAPLTNREGVRG